MKLPRAFFTRDTRIVARELLGMNLVRVLADGTRLAGRIVETEAYRPSDAASHSFRGQTPRNAPMFMRAGFSYVYFVYGMHFCFNVVTEGRGVGAAVLIRALEPLEGVEKMRENYAAIRQVSSRDLCRGPARLCKAMQIDRAYTGYDMQQTGGTLFIERGIAIEDEHVATSPRIGVSGDALAQTIAWRWFVRGSGQPTHLPKGLPLKLPGGS